MYNKLQLQSSYQRKSKRVENNEILNLHNRILTRRIHGNCRNHLRIGIVGVEGQWITPTNLQRDSLTAADRLEHVDHLVMRESQHARVIHVHQHVT